MPGFSQLETGLTAGSNRVVRVPLQYERDRRAWPCIEIWDLTNGGLITRFFGPRLVDHHTGANNSATLINDDGHFPQSLVGGALYNITDGSSTTITAVSGDQTTITGVLAGGTDNDWDTADEHMIVPPNEDSWVWCEPFTYELPTIARNGAAADCVSVKTVGENWHTEGLIYWHQMEAQTNLIDNPSLETGAGNPWIPDGWALYSAAAGEVTQDLGNFHSGASAIRLAAPTYCNAHDQFNLVIGQFYAYGAWAYETTDAAMIQGLQSDRMSFQGALAASYILNTSGAAWNHYTGVGRNISVVFRPGFRINDGGDGTFDDIYLFALDNVSLTATPASEANSLEATGIRVDGYDLCSRNVPAGYFFPMSLWYRWMWTPRHDAADLVKYGNTGPTSVHIWGNAANYVRVYATAANNIRLEFNDGGGVHQDNWNCAGLIIADTTYKLEVRCTAAWMRFYVDDAVVAEIVTPVNFAVVPTIIYNGMEQAGNNQVDAAYAAP